MSFLYSRRGYNENLRFRKGQRILCISLIRCDVDGSYTLMDDWTPAIIEHVNYQNYNKATMVTKIFPYKVRFLTAPSWNETTTQQHDGRSHHCNGLVEFDDAETCVDLTPENFIRLDTLNGLGQYYDDVFKPMVSKLAKKDNAPEQVETLMVVAASLRRTRILQVLSRTHIVDLDERLGNKLLHHAIHSQEQYALFPDHDYNHINHRHIIIHVENMEILMNWLRDNCNAPVERYRDEHDRHIEHIAVLRADVVLLKWLLWERWGYARVPRFRDMGRSMTLPTLAENSEANSSSTHQQTGMPTDAYGWSPLHYLLFCYPYDDPDDGSAETTLLVSVTEKINMLMHFYHTIHYVSVHDWDMKTPDGFTALDLVRDSELRSRQLQMFGLSLANCRGQYGRAPSKKEMNDVLSQCLQFQQYIYQETVYDAIQGDLDRNYDYEIIQQLVEERGLDTRPRRRDGTYVDPHTIVFKAASLGLCNRFRWLFDVLEFASLRTIDAEGRNLLQAAAHFNEDLRSAQTRMAASTNEHRIFRRAQRTVEKLQLLRSYKGDTWYKSPEKLLQDYRSDSIRRAMFEDVKQLIEGNEGRLEMVDMLYEYGISLPTTRFCIHECDYPTAKLLLEKKIKYCRAIEDWFQDSAPVAMPLTKAYLFDTDEGEADETLEDMALRCLDRHPWDVEDLLEFSRLLLFQWLVKGLNVIDPLKYRSKDGESLLHIAIRNKQVLVVFWLCVNYDALCHVPNRERGQLPAHLAIELADNYETSSLIIQAVVQYTGYYRHPVFLKGWGNDIHVWDLQDGQGSSLYQYAKKCKNTVVRQAVMKKSMKVEFSEALALLDHIQICDQADNVEDAAAEGEPSASGRGSSEDGAASDRSSEIDPDEL